MAEKLPRHVKGARPAFHVDAAVDRLVAMLLALTSEVSVLSDRVATLERLGQQAGWLGAGAVDAHLPAPADRAAAEARREAMLARVFHIVAEELADLEAGETSAAYWEAIARIEGGTA